MIRYIDRERATLKMVVRCVMVKTGKCACYLCNALVKDSELVPYRPVKEVGGKTTWICKKCQENLKGGRVI